MGANGGEGLELAKLAGFKGDDGVAHGQDCLGDSWGQFEPHGGRVGPSGGGAALEALRCAHRSSELLRGNAGETVPIAGQELGLEVFW